MLELRWIIAKNIAELRKAVPYTQAEFAEKINYSDKAVSKWERGESIPDVTVLKRIADLFGVTVDYLLTEKHPIENGLHNLPRHMQRNHALITGLACMLVFLLATMAFVILQLTTDFSRLWLAFVYAVPVCAIILIVFNSIWGRKKWNFAIISVLMWGILMCIYLTIGVYSNWLLFVIGVPGQVIIVMWSGIKARFSKKK